MSEKSYETEELKEEIVTEKDTVEAETKAPEAAIEPELVAEAPEVAEEPAASNSELETLRAENADLKGRLLRAHADLENFKKRAERDKQETVKYANKTVFGNLLAVIDNFDLAMMAAKDTKDPFVVGVDMIHKQLSDVLRQGGVEIVEAEGRAFDPYLHEAIAQEETDAVEENTVLQVLKKGYRYHGTLLRPAAVKVSKAISGPVVDETTAEAGAEETTSDAEDQN